MESVSRGGVGGRGAGGYPTLTHTHNFLQTFTHTYNKNQTHNPTQFFAKFFTNYFFHHIQYVITLQRYKTLEVQENTTLCIKDI